MLLCKRVNFPNLLLKELQDINDDVLVCSPALVQGLDMLIVAHKLANVCFQIGPLGFKDSWQLARFVFCIMRHHNYPKGCFLFA